ncbi:MAG: ISNCY family transposase, partial [bacterium]
MRQTYKKQITIGSKNIKEIKFDLNCRHEIIPILMGLQRINKKRKLLGEILDLIKQDVLGGKSEKHGTRGLCYWEILVLSAVRHGCNLDYDALQDLANNHK